MQLREACLVVSRKQAGLRPISTLPWQGGPLGGKNFVFPESKRAVDVCGIEATDQGIQLILDNRNVWG